MIHTGLVSITFRKLSPAEIVELMRKGGLEGIEWGGDVHVPHGDIARAREVRKMTADAGLTIPSYGSYYRVGLGEPAPFEAVLATAVELGAPVIRVWAGKKGSAEADEPYRKAVVDDSIRIAELAAKSAVTVAYEFHANTLTDTVDSALDLLKAANREDLKTYWQPRTGVPAETCLAELNAVLGSLSHVHAFYWVAGPQGRCPLADGAADWRQYFQALSAAGGDRYVMLEFVKDDSPEMFIEDAATLRTWQRDWLRPSP
ncbi:MAG TPA: sugar phosphate isomerase/epimerase family protein [Phycisphaerae bacterium]|nr:sugar phosphate isomerase/epimerase family protein [Phycisphaerae bacterium]HUT61403.1 sugar phosphate isomerase/epimerase family protein [Phycisphaerae bacterium]